MKKDRNNISALSLLLLMSLQSCGQTYNKMETYDQSPSQQIELKDSLFVLFTVKEWGKKNWYTWGVRSDIYKITSDEVEYFIGRTFYSPDKKKILVWIGEKLPNAYSLELIRPKVELNRICPTSGDSIYTMTAIIGYREAVNNIWKLYPYNQKQITCAPDIKSMIIEMEDYYFNQMKFQPEYVNKKYLDNNYGGEIRYDIEKKQLDLGYGDKNSPFIGKNFGYNLQDAGFWEKSLIWQKGARIPDLYNFQTKGNVSSNYKDFELIPPIINYPDSILKF